MSLKNQIESFNSRPANERRIIFTLALISAIMFVWLMIIKPLSGFYADAEYNFHAAKIEAAAVAAAITEIEILQNGQTLGKAKSPEAFKALVISSANNGGLSEIKAQIQNGQMLALKLEESEPFKTFQWLSDLETQYGIMVEQATVTATKKSNLISAHILLKQPQ